MRVYSHSSNYIESHRPFTKPRWRGRGCKLKIREKNHKVSLALIVFFLYYETKSKIPADAKNPGGERTDLGKEGRGRLYRNTSSQQTIPWYERKMKVRTNTKRPEHNFSLTWRVINGSETLIPRRYLQLESMFLNLTLLNLVYLHHSFVNIQCR